MKVSDLRAEIVKRERQWAGRDLVMIAVDGLSYGFLSLLWRDAIHAVQTTYPSTSSAAWMSSLTGLSPEQHGWPGARVRLEEGGEPVDVFSYDGPTSEYDPFRPTIFSDMRNAGRVPYAIVHDLGRFSSSFVNRLVFGANRISGGDLFGPNYDRKKAPPELTINRLGAPINQLLRTKAPDELLYIWSFLELDKHIHFFGYDQHVAETLELLRGLIDDLTALNCVVIVHADHGLVPTRNSVQLQSRVDLLTRTTGSVMGGAGRVRWFYNDGKIPARHLARHVSECFEGYARLIPPSLIAGRSSTAGRRVGSVVVEATGAEFLAPDGYRYDHGGASRSESVVPLVYIDTPSDKGSNHAA